MPEFMLPPASNVCLLLLLLLRILGATVAADQDACPLPLTFYDPTSDSCIDCYDPPPGPEAADEAAQLLAADQCRKHPVCCGMQSTGGQLAQHQLAPAVADAPLPALATPDTASALTSSSSSPVTWDKADSSSTTLTVIIIAAVGGAALISVVIALLVQLANRKRVCLAKVKPHVRGGEAGLIASAAVADADQLGEEEGTYADVDSVFRVANHLIYEQEDNSRAGVSVADLSSAYG